MEGLDMRVICGQCGVGNYYGDGQCSHCPHSIDPVQDIELDEDETLDTFDGFLIVVP